MDTKQIIVMRKDLNMRKGKMIAQGSHASMAFITRNSWISCPKNGTYWFNGPQLQPDFAREVNHWLNHSFRKITVYVNSKEELLAVYDKAEEAGLIAYLVTDNGATEFHGVPTLTCCAIGPHLEEKFEGITDHLPLL
jgi:PTH2 family peptidyl-tRNA hydrolase